LDRLLGYVRGGVAWQRDDLWATTTILGTAYAAGSTRPGWTIGVGAEYAFNRSLSSFVEYGYYNFGTSKVEFTPQVAGLSKAFVDITQTTNVLRVGVNYRFGGSAALITKR
jgi:outer membrane immunogenic protein